MALTTVRPQGMGFVTGRRNLVINGAMQVAQRGTVASLTSSSYGGPDRFRLGLSGAGTHRILQSATVPSGSGFSSSWRLDCTTADTSITSADQISCQYRIEGQDLQGLKKGTSSAEKVTLSFWVRSSLTGTYVVELMDRDNTRHIAKTYTISQADTFEYKTLTFDGDTTGALDNDNARSLQIQWWLAAGPSYTSGTLATSWASEVDGNRAAGHNVNLASSTSNNWYLTGVQLEIGENASDFEHRSYGEELALCQRYYWNMDMTGSNEFQAMTMWGIGPSDGAGWLAFPCEMRDHPSVSLSGTVGDNTQDWTVFRNGYKTITSVGSSAQNLKGCRIDVSSSSQWAHSDAFGLYATNSDSGAKFEVSAEL